MFKTRALTLSDKPSIRNLACSVISTLLRTWRVAVPKKLPRANLSRQNVNYPSVKRHKWQSYRQHGIWPTRTYLIDWEVSRNKSTTCNTNYRSRTIASQHCLSHFSQSYPTPAGFLWVDRKAFNAFVNIQLFNKPNIPNSFPSYH